MEYNATIDARDKNNVTVLREAIYSNNLNRTYELVKNGALVEIAKDSEFNKDKFEREMETTVVQQIIKQGQSLFQRKESPFGECV